MWIRRVIFPLRPLPPRGSLPHVDPSLLWIRRVYFLCGGGGGGGGASVARWVSAALIGCETRLSPRILPRRLLTAQQVKLQLQQTKHLPLQAQRGNSTDTAVSTCRWGRRVSRRTRHALRQQTASRALWTHALIPFCNGHF